MVLMVFVDNTGISFLEGGSGKVAFSPPLKLPDYSGATFTLLSIDWSYFYASPQKII